MQLQSTPTWLLGADVPPASRIGTVLIGTYRLDAFLGEGMMGVTYNAWHLRQKTPHAIKLLRRELEHTHERALRLRQDLRTLGTLAGRGFVQVELGFTPEGAPFLASELLVGETLRQRLSRGPLPLLEACAVTAAAALALHPAHELGVTHGDLRPENIFLTLLPTGATGQPVLLDAALHHLRKSGMALDELMPLPKLAYMAPEQAGGAVEGADKAGDVFALGAILYECLAGKPAFLASELEIVLEKLALGPGKLKLPEKPAVPPELTAALDAVIARACARDPEARFGSAAELASALAHAFSGCGLQLPPEPEAAPPNRGARRSTIAHKRLVPVKQASDGPDALAPQAAPEAAASAEESAPQAAEGAGPVKKRPRKPAATVSVRNVAKLMEEVKAGRLDAVQAMIDGDGQEQPEEDDEAAPATPEQTEAERIAAEGRAAVLARAAAAKASREQEERTRAERVAAEAKEAKRKVLTAARNEVLSKMRVELDQRDRERAARREETRREAERLKAERTEAERREKEQADIARREAERAEAARLEAERAEAALKAAQLAEAEQAEAELKAAQLAEAARLEAEQAEIARREAEQIERQREEAARLEAERAEAAMREAEAIERQRAEAEHKAAQIRQAADEAERLAAQAMEEVERAEAAARAEEAARLAAEAHAEEELRAQEAERARKAAEAAQARAKEAEFEAELARVEETRRAREAEKKAAEAREAEAAKVKRKTQHLEASQFAEAAKAYQEERRRLAEQAKQVAQAAEKERAVQETRVKRATQALSIVDLVEDPSEVSLTPPPTPAGRSPATPPAVAARTPPSGPAATVMMPQMTRPSPQQGAVAPHPQFPSHPGYPAPQVAAPVPVPTPATPVPARRILPYVLAASGGALLTGVMVLAVLLHFMRPPAPPAPPSPSMDRQPRVESPPVPPPSETRPVRPAPQVPPSAQAQPEPPQPKPVQPVQPEPVVPTKALPPPSTHHHHHHGGGKVPPPGQTPGKPGEDGENLRNPFG